MFDDLKKKGLIKPKRRLVSMSSVLDSKPDFHAGRLHRNRIYYRLGTARLTEIEWSFLLLHEEAHLSRYQNLWTLIMVIILEGLLMNRFPPVLGTYFFWFVILWATLRISMVTYVRVDEYFADKDSAADLKRSLGIMRPSEILKSTLDHAIAGGSTNPRIREKIVKAIYWVLANVIVGDPHPPLKKRIAYIVKKVDNREFS